MYRDGGIEAVRGRTAPGRTRRLTPEQEARLVERVKAGATPRDGVASLRGRQIQGILDREFGKAFSLTGIDKLLKRHGFVCLEPRPRHPRPTVVRQHGRKSIWVFAAVEQATGWSIAIPYREVNTETTQAFLPPYSPELNPVERLWHWFREHHWSNRTYADEQALVAEAIRSHRTLRRRDIPSICRTRWVTPEDEVRSVLPVVVVVGMVSHLRAFVGPGCTQPLAIAASGSARQR